MAYRGPQPQRIAQQLGEIMQHNAETGTWRQWVSAGTGNTSAYYAGYGESSYYREQVISGLWAAPQMGESRFRETQLPGGQVMAGDAVLSTVQVFNPRDEVIWRGVTYRIEGDATPIVIGGRVWWRTVLRRGDATG